MNNLQNFDYKDELKKIIKSIMDKEFDVTTFVGYDVGIGVPLNEMKDYKDEALNYCQDFEIGILNQGFFQMSAFNNEKWTTMRKYIEDNKDDISRANFFFCSTSLVGNSSPIMLYFPFLNIYIFFLILLFL